VADIWILDLDRSGATRLTNGPGYHMEPTWSPDSRRLAYARMFSGPRDLFSRVINGSTAEEPILKGPVLFKDPYSWSPDGKSVVFAQRDPQTNDDLWILPLEGDRKPTLYRKTPFNEDYASISPDGKWLAFISDESGRTEVYVQAFPTAGDAVQITTGGAALAWWRADGKELAILSGDLRTMFVADVQASAAGFHTSPPRVLAPMPKNALAIDAARDLQRFLASVTVDESVGSSITVLLNWLGALKKS